MDGPLMSGTPEYFGITYPSSTDLVKDGEANMQTIANGFDSAVAIPTYNAQTGATYTFALTDIGKTVTASNASASTYTIPPQASVVWPTGTTLEITNLGAGVVTFAAGAGVTVTNTAQTLAQYQSANLIRTGLNAWTVTPTSGGSSGLTLINTTTFSGVASQSFNSVFSSTYDYYVIKGRVIASGDNTLSWRIRDTTTDVTSSIYYFGGYYVGSSLGIAFASQNNTNTTSASLAFLDTNYGAIDLTVFNPFNTNYTSYVATTFGRSTNVYSGVVNDQLSHNGITFLPNTGTITGSISIFGVQK